MIFWVLQSPPQILDAIPDTSGICGLCPLAPNLDLFNPKPFTSIL